MWDLTVPGNNDHDFYVAVAATAVLVHNCGEQGTLFDSTPYRASPNSENDTFLYQKLSSTGEHLKYGITKNPATRYTSAELNGGWLNILASGSRQDMLALERSLHETLPIGPEEGQTPYIWIQVAKGLRPPRTDGESQVRYILVLQWPGDSMADFEALVSMEEQLDASLGRYASVDGHDFGSGEMNLFIETDRPAEAFADAANVLRGGPRWGDLRAAYREALGGPYEILWPQSLGEFSVK